MRSHRASHLQGCYSAISKFLSFSAYEKKESVQTLGCQKKKKKEKKESDGMHFYTEHACRSRKVPRFNPDPVNELVLHPRSES